MENFINTLSEIVKDANTSILVIREINGILDTNRFWQDAKDLIGDKYLNILARNGIITRELDDDDNANISIVNGVMVQNSIGYILSSDILRYKGYAFPYAKISDDEYKYVIILLNPNNLECQRISYHEVAHVFQRKAGVLKVVNTFNNFKKDVYAHYLEEAHADLFATACIMKDALDCADYSKRKIFLREQAEKDEEDGNNSTKSSYPSPKYYAHLSLIESFLLRIDYDITLKSYQKLAIECENHLLNYGRSKEDFMKFIA